MAFMILPQVGHEGLANVIKQQDTYLAWGDLPAFVDPPTNLMGVVDSTLGGGLNSGVFEYVVTAMNEFGETTPSNIFTVTVAINSFAIKLSWTPPTQTGVTMYHIYGRLNGDLRYMGSSSTPEYVDMGVNVLSAMTPPELNSTSIAPWNNSSIPNPSSAHRRLLKEVGRRKILIKKFVVQDPNGAYVTAAARWAESQVPTRHLYMYCGFDLSDAVTSTIYQMGVFINTVPKPEYVNVDYLTPEMILSPGFMIGLENITPINRNPSSREIHEFVMTY